MIRTQKKIWSPILLVLFISIAAVPAYAHVRNPRLKFDVKASGLGMVVYGQAWIPSEFYPDKGLYGDLEWVAQLTKSHFKLKGESSNIELRDSNQFWFYESEAEGYLRAVWGTHEIDIDFETEDTDGVYTKVAPPGPPIENDGAIIDDTEEEGELFIIGGNWTLQSEYIEDILDPALASMYFEGTYDDEEICGRANGFFGWPPQFFLVNLWIEEPEAGHAHFIWHAEEYYAPVKAVVDDHEDDFYILIPAAKRFKMRIKIRGL